MAGNAWKTFRERKIEKRFKGKVTGPWDSPRSAVQFQRWRHYCKGCVQESFEEDNFSQMCGDKFLNSPEFLAPGGLLSISIYFYRHFLMKTYSLFFIVYNGLFKYLNAQWPGIWISNTLNNSLTNSADRRRKPLKKKKRLPWFGGDGMRWGELLLFGNWQRRTGGWLSIYIAREGRDKTFQDFHLSCFSVLEFLKSSGIITAFCCNRKHHLLKHSVSNITSLQR